MAKALYGHVTTAPDRRLLDEVTKLRARVNSLEFENTRLRAENDRLAAAVAGSDEDEFFRVSGYVEDSGEGRWTVEEALRHAVPAPVISAALFARFASRQSDSPAMRAVAALRRRFGGHPVRTHRPPKE